MFRNKLLGIAAAATLGLAAMLGSTAANALKILDAPTTNRETLEAGPDSITYAAETLLMGEANVTKASDESDTTVYYNITDTIVLAAPADIGATEGDTYVVAITLDGMVFSGTALDDDDLSGDFDLAAGGAPGDRLVVFRATGAVDVAADVLSLTAAFAVSAGGGSATLTMTNQTLAGLNIPGVTGTKSHSGNVVKIAPGLDETAVAMSATADVVASFKKFTEGMSVASLGTLVVGVDTAVVAANGTALADQEDVMNVAVADGTPNSTVNFMGDFSFANRVFTHGDDDCGVEGDTPGESGGDDTTLAPAAGATGDLLIRDDDEMVTDMTMTKAVNVAEFEEAQHVCIMVQGEDDESEGGMDAPRIPATAAYTAMGSYMGLENAAIGPMSQMQTLGMIGRNGTTVHLPYLTTNAKFSQRVRIVNRGAAALYTIDLQSGDMPDEIEGTLDANSVTDLMVGGENGIVESIAGGRGATAGTLIVEAQPSMIDVVTIQISKELGTTDTVEYMPE